MGCNCNVGPGKFEGEPALAALAYNSAMLGGADVSTDDEDGMTAADFFKAPLMFDADEETVKLARQAGYCEECIAEALDSDAYGIGLFYSEQGFVHVEEYRSETDYLAAWLESEGVTGEPEEGDYVMFDSGPLGSRTSVSIEGGGYLGECASEDEAAEKIRRRMDREQFWPNVWYRDDHGGFHLRGTDGAA